MFKKISNHGKIIDRRCHCKGHLGNDLQLMSTDSVTNYGIMTTRKCTGELNPQTVKIKTLINRGTLVLHKCHCNSQLLQIIDLINYGIVVNCVSHCKLVKEEAPKPIGAPENTVKIGPSEVILTCKPKVMEVPPIKQLNTPNSQLNTPRELTEPKEKKFGAINTIIKNPVESSLAMGVSLNQLDLNKPKQLVYRAVETLKLPANKPQQNNLLTPINPRKRSIQTLQAVTTERPEKSVSQDLKSSNKPYKKPMETTVSPPKKLLKTRSPQDPHPLQTLNSQIYAPGALTNLETNIFTSNIIKSGVTSTLKLGVSRNQQDLYDQKTPIKLPDGKPKTKDPLQRPMKSAATPNNTQNQKFVARERPEKPISQCLSSSNNILKRPMQTAGNPPKKSFSTRSPRDPHLLQTSNSHQTALTNLETNIITSKINIIKNTVASTLKLGVSLNQQNDPKTPLKLQDGKPKTKDPLQRRMENAAIPKNPQNQKILTTKRPGKSVSQDLNSSNNLLKRPMQTAGNPTKKFCSTRSPQVPHPLQTPNSLANAPREITKTPKKNVITPNAIKSEVESSKSLGDPPNQKVLITKKTIQIDFVSENKSIKRVMEFTAILKNPQNQLVASKEHQEKSVSKDLISSNNQLKRAMETAVNLPKNHRPTGSQQDLRPSTVGDNPVQNPGPLQMCSLCAKGLQEHFKNFRFAGRIRCTFCLNAKPNKTELKKHMDTCQQEEKPYKCTACPFKSNKKSSLIGHQGTCFHRRATKDYLNQCLAGNHCSN